MKKEFSVYHFPSLCFMNFWYTELLLLWLYITLIARFAKSTLWTLFRCLYSSSRASYSISLEDFLGKFFPHPKNFNSSIESSPLWSDSLSENKMDPPDLRIRLSLLFSLMPFKKSLIFHIKTYHLLCILYGLLLCTLYIIHHFLNYVKFWQI